MKNLLTITFLFLTLIVSETGAFAAGEGTIPLRVTGRVVGSSHERIVANAKADISKVQQLPSQALSCLAGKQLVRKYLTQGKLTLNNRQAKILAVCIGETDQDVELFAQENSGAILRVIGRLKSAQQ